MVAREGLEIVALANELFLTFTQPVDAVLRVVAVNDGDIVTVYIVEVAGDKCRNGGFANTSLLCCECNEDFITHNTDGFNC